MALVDQSVRYLTRCVAPTRLGFVLSRWAHKHYSNVWAEDEGREVITEHRDRGLRMRVDRANYIGGVIYWRGFHSGRILRCLDRLLKPHMTLIDVGANQGEVTLYAARRLAQGKVIAFEPTPDIYQRLLNNMQLNGLSNVVTCDYCLGEERGQTELFTNQSGFSGQCGWHEGLASMFESGNRCDSIGTVEVHRLDDIMPSLNIDRLDVLKIDVEGAELQVLRGARESIARYRPSLIIEMNAETFQSAGYSAEDVSAFLQDLGYEGFQIDRSGRPVSRRIAELPDLCDMLWTPRVQ